MITPTDSNTIYIKPDDIGISKMHVKYEANRRAIGFLEHSMMRIGSNTEYIIMCHPMSLESKIFDEIRSKAFLGMRREDWGHIIISTVPNGLYLMVTEMDFEMDTGGLPTIHITAIEYTGPKPEKKIKKDPILTNLVKQIEEFENKIKEIKLKRRLENER